MSDIAQITYRDIVIAYSESRDQWTFELRGSQRWAKTLASAKAAIDKPAPIEKKPFTEFQAIKHSGYGETFETGRVTSIAERERYGTSRIWVWFVSGGSRTKEALDNLIAITPENEAAITEYKRLTAAIKDLEAKRRAVTFTAPTIEKSVELPETEAV